MEAHQQDDKAEKEGLVNFISALNGAVDLYEKGKKLYDKYYGPRIAQIKDLHRIYQLPTEKSAKEALSNIRDIIDLDNKLKEMAKE